MVTKSSAEFSRRKFLATSGMTVAAACITSKGLFAEVDNLVANAIKEAATAKITVQTLRRNITVLLGAEETSRFLPGPMESCSSMRKLSARVRRFPQLLLALMPTPSNN